MLFVDDQIPHLAEALALTDAVETFDARTLTNDLLRTRGATALFVRSVTRVDAALLHNTAVQFVGTATAGVDHVDAAFLAAENIRFASAPGCNANAVADYVLDVFDTCGISSNDVVGIIGCGHVGGHVARYARSRGMTVLVSDPPLEEAGHAFPPWITALPIDELLERSTVVTVHTPLTEQGSHPTSGLLHRERLDRCRPGTLVINTARGGIVDERALADHVSAGRLRAALDVFVGEPKVDPYVIERIPYCTPHIAGYTRQAKEKGARMVYEAYTGRPWPLAPTSAVDDPAQYSPPDKRAMVADFESVRRLTPLREERRTPPSWEECNVARP
jgi:erythronate-4-phosphate dehydrogenase